MNKSYYAIIPANVRYDKELTPNAKLLYGEITALCNEKGYCWASNVYFAELYKVSKTSISKWLSQLTAKGYITSKIIYRDGTKIIEERRLYITHPIEEKLNRYERKVKEGIEEKLNTPIEEKLKENNTVINNTVNIYKKEKETSLDKIINDYTTNKNLINTLVDFMKMRKSIKKPLTDRALKGILSKLDTLSYNDKEKIEILEQSIINCWSGVFPLKAKNNNSVNSIITKDDNNNSDNIYGNVKKTQFHNINQSYKNYTPEELKQIIKESQKRKFNK